MTPPETMPTIAAATARVAAPATPACSNSGAKANPVAGPPVRVTEPASTPISGCWPSSQAVRPPTTFCTTAISVASTKNSSTAGPPTRSSPTLAPKPIEVKNAIMAGVCNAVSKRIGVQFDRWAVVMAPATSNPPITGAGMLYLARIGMNRLMPYPANSTSPANAMVCTWSSTSTCVPRSAESMSR